MSRQKLVFKQPHHHIVLPGAVHESCLSLPAFNDEAAFFVSPDSALIAGKHPDSDSMKLQVDEGMSQQQENGFAAQAFTKQCRVENANCHGRASVTEIDFVQPDLAYKPAMSLDHPGMRMIDEPLDPSRRAVSCQRTHCAAAHAEHLDYFWMVTQGKTGFHVIDGSSPELKILSFQYGCHDLSRRNRESPSKRHPAPHLCDGYPHGDRSRARSGFRQCRRDMIRARRHNLCR